jgi:FG-GAP-like repeat
VTSDGWAHNGYVARFNYVLEGGFTYGSNGYYGQHFDVHGTSSSGPGSHDGGLAGEYYQIAFNTIRGEQDYGGFLGFGKKTRAAFELRGRSTIGAYFQDNFVVHDDFGEAIRLKAGDDSSLHEDRPNTFNLSEARTQFDKDYSQEVATGDFDGDGRTDVFVANGTAWFFSRAGVRPWEFLHASTKRTQELGFADIDNDGRTDVLYRDGSGNLGYLKSGIVSLVNFTTAPVAMKDLRFGDFDGDHKTDMFYTLGGQWWIWYGSTRTWTPAQSSGLPVSEFLFGEFDAVPGTDVAAVVNGAWSISSAGTAPWAKLNNKLRSSFADAVAADFDGNGKSDIAFSDGQKWVYSRDGRFPLVVLRDGDSRLRYAPLKSLLIGPFDGGTHAKVVGFDLKPVGVGLGPGERLVIWNGLGSGSAFSLRSEQNMR